jgi:RimJ/RimL family protein N-acetyltransferase
MGKLLGQTALDHAFNQLRLHKVCGQALASNQKSIRMHLSLGFQAEGILREQYSNGTTRQDIHCFGLLAHEWASLEGEARST